MSIKLKHSINLVTVINNEESPLARRMLALDEDTRQRMLVGAFIDMMNNDKFLQRMNEHANNITVELDEVQCGA